MQDNQDIRCGHCGRLLAKGYGVIEIKCPRCGAYTLVRAESPDPEPHDSLSESSNDNVG